jgi:hypothetical protein
MNMHSCILPVQNTGMDTLKSEISAVAARMVVEEGASLGSAKRRALKQMGLSSGTALPDNVAIEMAIEEYIAIYCAESQAQELKELRKLALTWMDKLVRFRPYLGGAVWHGSATRHSDVYLQLFCDDSKATEIELIDLGIRFQPSSVRGFKGEMVDALSINALCVAFGEYVGVHLLIYDLDALRGALVLDARGRRPRGDAAALRKMLHDACP